MLTHDGIVMVHQVCFNGQDCSAEAECIQCKQNDLGVAGSNPAGSRVFYLFLYQKWVLKKAPQGGETV